MNITDELVKRALFSLQHAVNRNPTTSSSFVLNYHVLTTIRVDTEEAYVAGLMHNGFPYCLSATANNGVYNQGAPFLKRDLFVLNALVNPKGSVYQPEWTA